MLPEKWGIVLSMENKDRLKNLLKLNNFYNNWLFTNYGEVYQSNIRIKNLRDHNSNDYPLYTIEQLEGFNTGKIIGYKAPKDLFNGTIKAGTLYRATASSNPIVYCAIKENGNIVDSGRTNLPKEIVEDWEPVYQPDYKVGDIVVWENKQVREIWKDSFFTGEGKCTLNAVLQYPDKYRLATEEEIKNYKKTRTLILGNKEIQIIIEKGFVKADNKIVTIQEVKNLLFSMTPKSSHWDIVFPTVTIGCSTFSYEDIQLIVKTYDEL